MEVKRVAVTIGVVVVVIAFDVTTVVISDVRSGSSYQWGCGMVVVTMTMTMLTTRGGGGDSRNY